MTHKRHGCGLELTSRQSAFKSMRLFNEGKPQRAARKHVSKWQSGVGATSGGCRETIGVHKHMDACRWPLRYISLCMNIHTVNIRCETHADVWNGSPSVAQICSHMSQWIPQSELGGMKLYTKLISLPFSLTHSHSDSSSVMESHEGSVSALRLGDCGIKPGRVIPKDFKKWDPVASLLGLSTEGFSLQGFTSLSMLLTAPQGMDEIRRTHSDVPLQPLAPLSLSPPSNTPISLRSQFSP